MNDEMGRLLEPLVGEDAIVSIYCDERNREGFWLGYLLAMDEDDLLLNLLSPGGVEDGYAAVCRDMIFTVGVDRPYSAKILKLSLLKGQKKHTIPQTEGSVLFDLLSYAQSEQAIVMLDWDPNFTGVVESYTDTSVTLLQVDEFGKEFGRVVADLDRVGMLRCRTSELRDIELLHRADQAGFDNCFIETGRS